MVLATLALISDISDISDGLDAPFLVIDFDQNMILRLSRVNSNHEYREHARRPECQT